jgi:hypothetical protein
MPRFNLAPKPENLEPQWQNPAPQSLGTGKQTTIGNDPAARQEFIRQSEQGPFKPLAQLFNALASPDTKAGIVTGPINGASKLGNALGDLVQGKPIDVRDAWTISDQTVRQNNPFRNLGGYGQTVLPADQAGLAIGEGIGAELAGAATGATLLQQASKIRRLQQAAQAFQQQAAVRRAAVAVTASPGLKAGANVLKNVGEAIGSTALATPFLDQEDGNLANLGDAAGLKLPGRVEPGENYLQALGKSIAVEGIAAPLALLGMGAMVTPIREGMAKGDLGWVQQLADAELEPYLPRQMAGPALPPAGQAGLPQLPGYSPQGGALVPYDSAISRSLQEQTQIRQVIDQRQRLQQMGLAQQGEGGQLDLALGGAVDPEIRSQVRQLQTQRGLLIKQGMESGQDMTQDLGKIDQEIGDLIQSGNSADFMPSERFTQPELDMPDGRPELDTYLANLDEMGDADLRQIHSRVYADLNAERSAQELATAQQQVTELQGRLAEIDQRVQAGDITPIGAKRLIGKAQKELALAQQQVGTIEARGRVPEALVGDQLQLRIEQQGQLDLATEAPLPPFEQMTRGPGEYGYQKADDYRTALQGWNRDQLRRLAMPDSSPEVAALVKARTGRRVWNAKKEDIIDALVEISERRGRYLPPEAEQLAMELKANQFGDAAPLFDRPADLSAPGMTKVLDADGVEQLVPAVDYSGRGMDAATRERLKAEILQRAIDNGEVQAPISPLPNRPVTTFEQSSLVDDLLADPEGQLPLLFASDAMPTYKAGGKGGDAWIEEMRLRFEYNLLDEQAQQAQRDALKASKGWDTLTWEEKKQLGILGDGFYSLKPYSERFRDPTPAARSDLDTADLAARAEKARLAGGVEPPRKPSRPPAAQSDEVMAVRQPKQYEWKPGGEVAEAKPAAASKPATAKAPQPAAPKAVKADLALDKKEAELRARLDALKGRPTESAPAAAPAAPAAKPVDNSAEIKKLTAELEKIGATRAKLAEEIAKPVEVASSNLPSRKLNTSNAGRVEVAAQSLFSWGNAGTIGGIGPIKSYDEAVAMVTGKGRVLDPDALPGVDIAAAREAQLMGRVTPDVEKIRAAYLEFYGSSQQLAPDAQAAQARRQINVHLLALDKQESQIKARLNDLIRAHQGANC